MSEPETIQSLSAKLKDLEDRLSVLHGSAVTEIRQVAQGCAQEVGRLQSRLTEFAVQQSEMILALRATLPGFDLKLDEVHKAAEKELHDTVNQIVQNVAALRGRKPG